VPEAVMPGQLVLASASPRRKELLERAGFTVKPMPAQIDESLHNDESAEAYVKRMARRKVLTVVERIQQTLYPETDVIRPRGGLLRESPLRWVLGADTVVVQGNGILGKPEDHAEAVEMLTSLQGAEHFVITGFCLYDMRKSKEGLQAVHTAVRMKKMSRTEIEKYLSVGESMDKAGAYAIQGVGSYIVDSISGSYTNVVGLPICQVVEMMEEMGATDITPF
jgi:septum formation protein